MKDFVFIEHDVTNSDHFVSLWVLDSVDIRRLVSYQVTDPYIGLQLMEAVFVLHCVVGQDVCPADVVVKMSKMWLLV